MADMPWHRIRKRVHVFCFLAFLALPFFDVMRFDIPRQRFFLAGYELWIDEFGIIFFALMFLMFLVVAFSIFFGRVYCGYLCPQMIFSEISIALENRLRRWINKRASGWKPVRRKAAARVLFLGVLAVTSIFLAFAFVSYFVEPRDLFRRLTAFDLRTAAGISGAVVTAITFLDFTFVRQRFCTTVCPYGYLQGMLADGNTLLVEYRDPARECIECTRCMRVCHMGIDIRKSPHQIECIHCGECIDACTEVLRRLGKQTLIRYRLGSSLDARRIVILLVLLFYAAGLFIALSMRRAVLVRIAPDRTTLYTIRAGGKVYNKFRIAMANRGKRPAAVRLSVEGLPASLPADPVPLDPGAVRNSEIEIGVTPAADAPEVTRFFIVATIAPEQLVEKFPMTFILPAPRRTE